MATAVYANAKRAATDQLRDCAEIRRVTGSDSCRTATDQTGFRARQTPTLHPRYDEGLPSAESCRIANIRLGGWKLRLAGFLLVVILHELLRGTTCCGAEKLFLSVRIIAEFFRQNFRKRLIIALGDRLVGPKDFAIRCNHFGIERHQRTHLPRQHRCFGKSIPAHGQTKSAVARTILFWSESASSNCFRELLADKDRDRRQISPLTCGVANILLDQTRGPH